MAQKDLPDKDLHKRLHEWMTSEMHFHPQGQHIHSRIPSPEDLKGIVCGPLKDIWKYVIHHIHSVQTVKTVKGNLNLKKKKTKKYKVAFKSDNQYNEKEQMLEDRSQLTGEVTNVLGDISHLISDVRRIENEIERAEEDYNVACQAVEELKQKACLLQCFSHQCKENVQLNQEFTKRIDTRIQKINNLTKKGEETQYYSRKHSSTDEDHYSNSNGLETKADKEVRKTCQQVGEFLQSVLKGNFGNDKEALQRHKEGLWKEIESVMGEVPPSKLYFALVMNAQDSSLSVKEATSKINIRTDAEHIRFKFEKSGELRDLSHPPSLVESVHHLIEETQMKHIMRFMETEKHKNEIWKKEQELNEIKQKVDKQLGKAVGTQKLKTVRSCLETEMELSGKRAALASYMDEADNLQEKISKTVHDKEILMSKYQKIQDFQNIADKKQNLIRILIKQNGNAKTRLEEQKTEIDSYIKSSLPSHKTEVKAMTSSLKGCVSKEVEKFNSLQLPYLLMVMTPDSLFKVACMDLSIHVRSLPMTTTVRQSLEKVLKDLHVKKYVAPECFLPLCFEMKIRMQESIAKLQLSEETSLLLGSHSQESDVVHHITDLCQEIETHDKMTLESMLPPLQQRIDIAVKSLKECINLEQAIEDWWNQPAQHLAPWVTYNNHNLQQWIDRWTVIVTSLRQLILQKQDK